MKLDPSLLKSSERATAAYEANIERARSYLQGRGFQHATAVSFRLGVVVEPEPEHVDLHVTGRLAIPYLTRAGVVSMRFRLMGEGDPKYLGLPDSKPRLFGVNALFQPSPFVAITEGEIDAMILNQCGIPAVGCPGVSTWQEHMPPLFAGYERVLIFADGDEAGKDFARRVRKDLDNATTVTMPDGMDVNDVYLEQGADALRERAGL